MSDEGLNRIVSAGVLPAVQKEIDLCKKDKKQTVDVTVSAIRMIIDSYDKYFHTGRAG